MARTSWTAFPLAVCFLLGAQQAAAIILNPSFETGDTRQWNTAGDVSVTNEEFGVDPYEGDYQLLLTSNGALVPDTESAMGLSAGRIQQIFEQGIYNLGESTGSGPTQGAAFQQTFEVTEAGDTVTFYYNFLTDEGLPDRDPFVYTDFLWWELDRPIGANRSGVIAHVNQDIFSPSSGTDYDWETGYQSFTIRLNQPGTYTLTIGLHDVQDILRDTAAVIDGFWLSKTPEPNTFFLLAAGLLGLAFHARWVKGSGRKS